MGPKSLQRFREAGGSVDPVISCWLRGCGG